MSNDVLLAGVDIGTTNIKAILFDCAGQTVAAASVPTPTEYPRPGWAHYEPAELWNATVRALRLATGKVAQPERIASIAFTSMGETAIPVDRAGQPTYHAIAWFDRRTELQARWLAEQIGAERIFRASRLAIQPIFGLCKMMWLRDNEPEAYNRTVTWLNTADYMAYRLCGEGATDYSLASRSLALDLANLRWNTELIAEAGIRPEIFAPLVASGTALGTIQPEMAAATGLPGHTVVAVGGHDHICGAMALGVVRPDSVLDSMGSAEAVFLPIEQIIDNEAAMRQGYAQGAHVAGGYYILGGQHTSSAAVEWFRAAFAGNADYATLIREAEGVPPGSFGAVFLPHLRMANTPHNDSMSMGAFIGLTTDSKRGQLFRALLEGIAFEERSALEPMLGYAKKSSQRIVATGGGTRNHLLMQIKASVYNQPITVVSMEEATALGAAMLGGLGAGVYANVAAAVAAIRYDATVVEPERTTADFYDELFHKVYSRLYGDLRAVHHASYALNHL